MIPNQEKRPPAPEMVPVRAFRLALLCSFSVYFIPIIGPHAIFFIWESLWQHLRTFSKNPAWSLTELGATLLLQAVAFALFYWFWRRRGVLRAVVVLVCGIAAIVQVQYVFFVLIPAQFMIEKETAKETGSWPEACQITDAQLLSLRTPRRMPKGGWSEAWVSSSQVQYSMLRMPDCQRTPANLPQPKVQPGGRVDFMVGIVQAVEGGLALVQRHENVANKDTWLLLNATAGTLNPMPAPVTTQYVAPYLSDDGTRTGWVIYIPGSPPPMLNALHVLPVEGGAAEQLLDLSAFGPNTYEVIGLDGKSGSALFWASQPLPGHLLATGMDGKQHPSPNMPDGVRPQSHTLILSDHGVVAWDAYKEDENYIVAWTLDTGTGFHKIPKGSSINAVATDPDGRYVAISTATSLNVGSTKDTVFVLRTSDGQEVFRRFLPTYNRTNVVFLGREWFAYSDFGTTHVLRIE